MIVRLLSRYADARLRASHARAIAARNDAEHKTRVAEAERDQARAEATTNYALAQQWRSIALRTRDALDASERARTQETHQ